MEEIEEQYAIYLAKGVVLDKDGFPIGSGESHVLGGGGASSNGGLADRRKALEAAESRRKRNANGLTSGYVLGGKSSSIKKDPREAARIAAERRLLDSQYCLPCNEIIEILGEDTEDEGGDDEEVEIIERAAAGEKTKSEDPSDDNEMDLKPKAKTDSSGSDDDVIDLTLDDSFTTVMSPVSMLKPASKSKRKNNELMGQSSSKNDNWPCPRCTFANPPMILVCDVCNLERPCDKTILEQAMTLKREDDIEDIKEREVKQSIDTFGFNIYGNNKDPSATMKHLT